MKTGNTLLLLAGLTALGVVGYLVVRPAIEASKTFNKVAENTGLNQDGGSSLWNTVSDIGTGIKAGYDLITGAFGGGGGSSGTPDFQSSFGNPEPSLNFDPTLQF